MRYFYFLSFTIYDCAKLETFINLLFNIRIIFSQAHNYFIHKLVNDKDIKAISNAVSYIDKLSLDSIPTLEVGTCIFSGTAVQFPLKINIFELDKEHKPQSNTIKYQDLISK